MTIFSPTFPGPEAAWLTRLDSARSAPDGMAGSRRSAFRRGGPVPSVDDAGLACGRSRLTLSASPRTMRIPLSMFLAVRLSLVLHASSPSSPVTSKARGSWRPVRAASAVRSRLGCARILGLWWKRAFFIRPFLTTTTLFGTGALCTSLVRGSPVFFFTTSRCSRVLLSCLL